MKKIITVLMFFCGFTNIVNATSLDAFQGKKGTINIAGGTAHIPVMKMAAQQIMQANPAIRITVAGGGSGVGIRMAGEGLAQIGNAGRALKPSEIAQYNLHTFPFAIDGVAIVVNPENTVQALSKKQLIDVFTGKITNWKALGGNDAAISIYTREDGSGTRETFETLALDNAQTLSSINVVNSNGAMKTAVSQDPNAIGYVGIGHLNTQVKGIILEGMTPSQKSAADGSYRITRLLYMNTKGKPEGIVADFIDYIYSNDGQKIIEKAGYIPKAREQ